MAYSNNIAEILTGQLTRFAALNRHQLAGHVANLEFWTAEVRHCLDVIDGYNRRFERMKASQGAYAAEHQATEFLLHDPRHTQMTAPPPRRVPSKELGNARRDLCDATYRFLIRCLHEGLIDESELRKICNSFDIGVEARDLRRRTHSP